MTATTPIRPVTTPREISSEIIGPYSRYRLVEFQGRYGDREWFLYDAENLDDCGLPLCVMQGTESACRAAADARAEAN